MVRKGYWNMKKTMRLLALGLVFAMLAALLPMTAAAAYSDVPSNYWAADKINEWTDKGYMSGPGDGTFRPEGNVTRAEFARITNNAFSFTSPSNLTFPDVPATFWGYRDVQIARAMGYVTGYPDGTFKPQGNITRQEAAKIICTILNLEQNPQATYGFADYMNIDDWARGYVGAVYANKIMGRYSDNTFKARQNLTRAECVDSLWNGFEAQKAAVIVENYTVTTSKYAPAEPVTVRNLSINYAGDVTVENVTVLGDVTVASKVADRTLTLKNCTIEGSLKLDFGNLELDGVILGTLLLSANKAGRTVTLKNITTVETATTDRSVTIDQSAITGTGKGIETLYVGGSNTATVSLKGGTFPNVQVARRDQRIELIAGTISELTSDYAGFQMLLGQGTVLAYATLGANDTRIEGPGVVQHAYLDARNITFQRDPLGLSGPYTSYNKSGDWKLGFTVSDANTGKGISGAKVTLGSGWATGTTNSSGYIEFANVPNRDIDYTVTLANFKEVTATANNTNGHRYLNVPLVPTGTWRATIVVQNAAGVNLSGAYAILYNNDGKEIQKSTTSTTYHANGQTVSDGKVYFENLGNSTYRYKVFADGYITSAELSFAINGKDNDAAGTVRLNGTKTELKLLDSFTGAVIPGFEVKHPTTGTWISDGNKGTAVLEGLSAGNYNLDVRLTGGKKADYILDNPATFTTRVTISLSASDVGTTTTVTKTASLTQNKTYSYTGVVTNLNNEEIENGKATLTSAIAKYTQELDLNKTNGRPIFTGAPAANDYVLTITATGYNNFSEKDLMVGTGSLSKIVKLVGVRTISFILVDTANGNAPLANVEVKLSGIATGQITNKDGVVTFANVTDGIYTISIDHATLELVNPNLTVGGPIINHKLDTKPPVISFSLYFSADADVPPANLKGDLTLTPAIGGAPLTVPFKNNEYAISGIPLGKYFLSLDNALIVLDTLDITVVKTWDGTPQPIFVSNPTP